MTLDGNHVQIPNSTVYKSSIQNFTSNPNRREMFTIGIGYEDVIPEAQELALQVLRNHPAILKDPEPWVLVDSLGTSTVNLKVYFWLNGAEHSWLKVRSSAIRLIKRAYQDTGISMPDEAREVVFPHGVPVEISRVRNSERKQPLNSVASARNKELADPSTLAEGGLTTEAKTIASQAQGSRLPEQGKDLLSE